jgi:hypothetical protein
LRYFLLRGQKQQAVVEVKSGCGLSIHNLLQRFPSTAFSFCVFPQERFLFKGDIHNVSFVFRNERRSIYRAFLKKAFLVELKEGEEEMDSDRAIEMTSTFFNVN